MVTTIGIEHWLWEYDCVTQAITITDGQGTEWRAQHETEDTRDPHTFRPRTAEGWRLYRDGEPFSEELCPWRGLIATANPDGQHEVRAAAPVLSARGYRWQWQRSEKVGQQEHRSRYLDYGHNWFEVAVHESDRHRFIVRSRFNSEGHQLIMARHTDRHPQWVCVADGLALENAYVLAECAALSGFEPAELKHLAHVDDHAETLQVMRRLNAVQAGVWVRERYSDDIILDYSRLCAFRGHVKGWIDDRGKVKYTILGIDDIGHTNGTKVVFENATVEDFIEAIQKFHGGARVTLEPDPDFTEGQAPQC